MPAPVLHLKDNYASDLQQVKIFEMVSQCAAAMNIEAYVVGGYVRDLILGKPVKDVDIVTLGEGSGMALAQGFATMFQTPNQVTIFKKFGTASLHYDGYSIEFVGARRESYSPESRKPVVENGTLADDQYRRDFTINAMSISLNRSDFGKLIDPFDGLRDLEDKLIITPADPDITFSDDPLRMLRAIRFASRLDFDIAAETFEAIKRNAHRIKIISAERIVDELNKTILTAKPSYGFKLMFESGLLELFFPEMVALHGVENVEGKSHKDNFYHTLEVLDNVAKAGGDLWLRWAAILHDIAKPATKRYVAGRGFTFHGHEDKGARMVPGIFKRLKLPTHEPMRFVQKLVRMHLRPIGLGKEYVTDSAIRRILVDAGDDIEALMTLCKADVTTKNPAKAKRHIENFNRVLAKMNDVQESDALRNFQPVINGQHIMFTFGWQPGPQIGPVKTAIRDMIIDGTVPNDFDQAYEAMLAVGLGLGHKPVRTKEEVIELAAQLDKQEA